MMVAMYFLLIRPQQKRRREQQEMQNKVGVGAEVMTVGGLYGTIVDSDDESITIEVAPGVTNRYAKGAIGRVVRPADAVDADEEEAEDEVTDEVEDTVEETEPETEPEVVEEPEPEPGVKAKEQVAASNQALPRDPTAN